MHSSASPVSGQDVFGGNFSQQSGLKIKKKILQLSTRFIVGVDSVAENRCESFTWRRCCLHECIRFSD